MTQIIALILIVVAWYVGYRMAKSEGDIVIGYREVEIKSLRAQLERTDRYVDTLFDDNDMIQMGKAGYAAGTRRDESWTPEKWLAETFRPVQSQYDGDEEGETIQEWARQYHADVKVGKKTY